MFTAPAVRESQVRSTPQVTDCDPVALDDPSLLRDPCEKCNPIDFTVLFSLTPRDGSVFLTGLRQPLSSCGPEKILHKPSGEDENRLLKESEKSQWPEIPESHRMVEWKPDEENEWAALV